MTREEEMLFQGIDIKISKISAYLLEVLKKQEAEEGIGVIPAWCSLEVAAALKGGASLTSYRQRKFLMPCCGRAYKKVGGRRCWSRENVREWLDVSDEELPEYAKKWDYKLPQNYLDRGVE